MNLILILVVIGLAVAVGYLFLTRPSPGVTTSSGGGSSSGGLDAGKVGLAALGGALSGIGSSLEG